MKLLTITLVGISAKAISTANLQLKSSILKGVDGLTVAERNQLFEHYKVKSTYELLTKFSFVTENRLRKLFIEYNEKGYGDFPAGLGYIDFKKEMGALGYRKGLFFINSDDPLKITLFVMRFIGDNLEIINNVYLNVYEQTYIDATNKSIFDKLVSNDKFILNIVK